MQQVLKELAYHAGKTVITMDDGFYSTWKHACLVLQEVGLPAAICVTSYYCLKRSAWSFVPALGSSAASGADRRHSAGIPRVVVGRERRPQPRGNLR